MQTIPLLIILTAAGISVYALRRLYLVISAMEARRFADLAEEMESHSAKANAEPPYGAAEMAKEFIGAALLAVLFVACIILAFAH
jgi:hypothetical protein